MGRFRSASRNLKWTLASSLSRRHLVRVTPKLRPVHAGLYHVSSGGTRPDPFFRDTVDRGIFVVQLATMLARTDVVCIGFCLLATHYHAILDADEGALPHAMQRLNWHYARATNRRHGRLGHAVGRRYMAVPIESDAHLVSAFRYVAWNPVEAGECSKPQHSRWSSYATTAGLRADYSFVDASRVVGCFGRPRAVAIQRLRGFVETPSVAPEIAPWPPRVARRAA
jgi:putative transposase